MSEFGNLSSVIYDCIVVGLGGHGSSAVAHLAKQGLNVLGIEQFDRVHEKGLRRFYILVAKNSC